LYFRVVASSAGRGRTAGSLAVALALVAGFSAGDGQDAPSAPEGRKHLAAISVSPEQGGPRTTFVLKARNLRSARADYGFRLKGPGGRSCDGRLSARFVMATGVSPHTVRRGYERRYIPPQRQEPLTPSVAQAYDRRAQNAPWCPGTYRLAVKRIDALRKRPSSPIATVTFTVGSTTGRGEGPRRPSHGVSEASIDEGISETPYRQVVDRYGKPKSVPPEYRMVGGRRCIYYDFLGPDADTPACIASLFRLCFRNGKVDSASGESFVLLPPPRARPAR
jgi:hypothetical protein